MGDLADRGRGQPPARGGPGPGDHRQRPAGHDLRRLRHLAPDRRLTVVLVGRRPGGAPGRTARAGRAAQPRHAVREVPGAVHQRREPGAGHVGAGVLRSRAGAGARRRLQPQVLREGLRDHAAAAGELPVAGGVGPGLRRGRSRQPRDRHPVRRRHGHLARGADVAGHRGVEPARGGRGARRGRQDREAGTRRVRRHGGVELPPQPGRAEGVLDRRHPAHGRPEHRRRGHGRDARQRRHRAARRRQQGPDAGDHRRAARDPGPGDRKGSGDHTAGVDALQGGPAVLAAGTAAAGRRHRGVPRRQLGEHVQAARPHAAAPGRRLRPVLPLRLRRRRPLLQVGGHGPDRQRLGAAQPGRHVRHRPAVGGQRRRHEGQRAAAAVLPRLRLEPVPGRAVDRVGAAVRPAELRRAERGRRRRGPAHLRPAAVPPQAGAAQTAGSASPRARTRPPTGPRSSTTTRPAPSA